MFCGEKKSSLQIIGATLVSVVGRSSVASLDALLEMVFSIACKQRTASQGCVCRGRCVWENVTFLERALLHWPAKLLISIATIHLGCAPQDSMFVQGKFPMHGLL